ncbi:MAG: hypothetical protein ACFFE8_15000 [Candidatus Heimdallarchaeota archaeon]
MLPDGMVLLNGTWDLIKEGKGCCYRQDYATKQVSLVIRTTVSSLPDVLIFDFDTIRSIKTGLKWKWEKAILGTYWLPWNLLFQIEKNFKTTFKNQGTKLSGAEE